MDRVVDGLPLGDDGDAIAKLDEALRPRLLVVVDTGAPAPEGMAVGEYETHGAAPDSQVGRRKPAARLANLVDLNACS